MGRTAQRELAQAQAQLQATLDAGHTSRQRTLHLSTQLEHLHAAAQSAEAALKVLPLAACTVNSDT